MAIVWDGKARAVCPVCGPSGCVDGPAHGVVFADEPESTAEALEAYWRASGRVLGWFRADPLDEAKPRVAVDASAAKMHGWSGKSRPCARFQAVSE